MQTIMKAFIISQFGLLSYSLDVSQTIPTELKSDTSLNIFKAKIKLWKPQNCPCKLCKIYVCGVGYMH